MTLNTLRSEGQPALPCACCGDPLGFVDEVARATAGVRVCGACLDRDDYLVPIAAPRPLTYPPCTGGEPPAGCERPMPAAFLSARAYVASLPPGELVAVCPACGSRAVAPLYWPDPSPDPHECFDCKRLFSGRD